ncbi:putative leader peptide [Pseudonocardia alaniniphila]|uniref:putative leader peptide n=1 Tax=Pseudonocardia alaniniphila TaxID=75291 RepID=UPI003637C4F6
MTRWGRSANRVSPLPACGRRWIADRTSGTLFVVTALTLRLVARRHVDLHRVSSALCRQR